MGARVGDWCEGFLVMTHIVCLVPGDGVGPEVTSAARRVIRLGVNPTFFVAPSLAFSRRGHENQGVCWTLPLRVRLLPPVSVVHGQPARTIEPTSPSLPAILGLSRSAQWGERPGKVRR